MSLGASASGNEGGGTLSPVNQIGTLFEYYGKIDQVQVGTKYGSTKQTQRPEWKAEWAAAVQRTSSSIFGQELPNSGQGRHSGRSARC
jgi:hypothetical protein